MSWSFYGVGKPAAVLAKARDELARVKCAEPEEFIKSQVAAVLEVSLTNMPAATAVQVDAAGSQTKNGDGTASNQLTLNIKPLYGFVE